MKHQQPDPLIDAIHYRLSQHAGIHLHKSYLSIVVYAAIIFASSAALAFITKQ